MTIGKSKLVFLAALVVLGAVAAGGCKKETGPKQPEETLESATQDLRNFFNQPVFSDQEWATFRSTASQKVSSYRIKWGTQAEGKKTLVELSRDQQRMAKNAYDQKQFKVALNRADVALELNSDNRLARDVKQAAEIEVNKPKLTITGFMTLPDKGEHVFITVKHPQTGREEKVQVKVGDEFAGYVLREIFENPDGVKGIHTFYELNKSEDEFLYHAGGMRSLTQTKKAPEPEVATPPQPPAAPAGAPSKGGMPGKGGRPAKGGMPGKAPTAETTKKTG